MSLEDIASAFRTHCHTDGLVMTQDTYDEWLDNNPAIASIAPLCLASLDSYF